MFSNLFNRITLNNPANRKAKAAEICKVLKGLGLGNNNTKRAEAAEAIIRTFTGEQPAEAPEVVGKSPIAKS